MKAPTSDLKTTNLRAALSHLTPADEVLIFADADIWMDRDWIKHLVAPLVDESADVRSENHEFAGGAVASHPGGRGLDLRRRGYLDGSRLDQAPGCAAGR